MGAGGLVEGSVGQLGLGSRLGGHGCPCARILHLRLEPEACADAAGLPGPVGRAIVQPHSLSGLLEGSPVDPGPPFPRPTETLALAMAKETHGSDPMTSGAAGLFWRCEQAVLVHPGTLSHPRKGPVIINWDSLDLENWVFYFITVILWLGF